MPVPETRQTEDGLDDRQTEDGLDLRVTEALHGIGTVSIIIKYEMVGASNVRERAAFKFEFPQKLFVVLE